MAEIDSLESLRQSNYEKYKDMFKDDKHNLVTMDNFYSLLVAEMQNQDPLEPTSNTEFISQMASFTALQAQQDAFETQQSSYANSLVGQTVTIGTPDGQAVTGVVSYVTLGETPMVNVDGTNYALSSVRQLHTNSNVSSSIGDYGAFASSLLGKTAVVQSFGMDGMPYYDEGVVDSLEIENGNVRIIVNGYAYDVTDVVRVTETAAPVQNTSPVRDAEPVQNSTVPNASVTENAASQAAAAAEEEEETEYSEEEDIADISETEELMQLFNE